jgi:outer membrane protein TolC
MRAILTAHLFVLAACAAPEVESADALLADAWRPAAIVERADTGREQPAQGARDAEPHAWTLDSILAEIARANPTLAAAHARIEEARAIRRSASASYLPELSLGLDYLATDSPSRAFAILLDQRDLTLGPSFDPEPGTVEDWRKEVRLDWALFEPGRSESRDAARAGEESAHLAARAVERRLLNAGVQAWTSLRAARALESVARESVAVVERRVEVTRTRHDAGAALKADVLRLEVRLAAAREEAARSALAVRGAESTLKRLMGRPSDEPLELAEEEVAIGASLPGDLAALLSIASAERADLAAAAHRARAAAFEQRAARSSRLPSLRAFAAYDVDGPDLSIDRDLDSYTLGVGLRLPLSARTRPEIERATAAERRARAELADLALAVEAEVRDAFEAVRVARETLALAESSVGAAEEAYRIVSEAQDAGAATATDVLEAESARNGARVRSVAARAGVEIASARLAAAIGGVR